MRVMDAEDETDYGRFERLARRLVNTPKPKASAEDLPPADEPAADDPERERSQSDSD